LPQWGTVGASSLLGFDPAATTGGKGVSFKVKSNQHEYVVGLTSGLSVNKN